MGKLAELVSAFEEKTFKWQVVRVGVGKAAMSGPGDI